MWKREQDTDTGLSDERCIWQTPLGLLEATVKEEALYQLVALEARGQASREVTRFRHRQATKNLHHPPSSPLFDLLEEELTAYFNHVLTDFSVPLDLKSRGTAFQKKVWSSLIQVPYGETLTYKEFALRFDLGQGYQAVGSALGRNPWLILLPCHRIVARQGIGGFSAGLSKKIVLLTLERGQIKDLAL